MGHAGESMDVKRKYADLEREKKRVKGIAYDMLPQILVENGYGHINTYGHGVVSEEKAEKWDNDICEDGIYLQRFIKKSIGKPTKALINLQNRLEKLKNDHVSYAYEHRPTNVKAKCIGCKNCGSKFNTELMGKKFRENDTLRSIDYNSKCLLCDNDLRSETTLKTLNRYKERISNLEKRIKKEEKRIKDKQKGEEYWKIVVIWNEDNVDDLVYGY